MSWHKCFQVFFAVTLVLDPVSTAMAEEPGFDNFKKSIYEQIKKQKELLRQNPDDPEAYFRLGLAYMRLGRKKDEIDAYKQVVRLKPDYAEAYSNLGIVFDKIGEAANAISNTLKAQAIYQKRRDHRGIRNTARRLRQYYDKYGLNSADVDIVK